MLGIRWISKILAFGASLSAGVALADTPRRVVSINLCTDQMAMLLAAPDQLVSISFLARDPQVSAMSEQAQNYAPNHGDLEEIVALEPDLVLVHEWSSAIIVNSLEALGLHVERFAAPRTLSEIPSFVSAMGAALGQAGRADAINAEFAAKLTALDQGARDFDEAYRLIDYGPNGWISGGDALGAELIAKAGFENIASEYGYDNGGFMPLETLVISRPDIVLTGSVYPASSRAEALLSHPALMKSNLATHEMRMSQAWSCGLPQALDGYQELIDLHQQLSEG